MKTLPESLFIRQSIQSDYCAVYATAMFLSLAGYPVHRAKAQSLFSVRRRGWDGATHEDIHAAVLEVAPSLRLQWRRSNPTTPLGFLRVARRRWSAVPPLLVTAYCRHRKYNVRDWHAFVVVSVTNGDVQIIDPLAKAPTLGQRFNARIYMDHGDGETRLNVEGAPWDLDLSYPIWSMHTLAG